VISKIGKVVHAEVTWLIAKAGLLSILTLLSVWRAKEVDVLSGLLENGSIPGTFLGLSMFGFACAVWSVRSGLNLLNYLMRAMRVRHNAKKARRLDLADNLGASAANG